ncbi:TVG1493094 [Thermoplasma volcanium GSS1]|uniref:TVG1493094 protein n=1 Tax=Thermoplasma volcanium (strain ATCC 51530 / DSM 4299 / JCM 9571 / NBRC 15438 / GSS1) TaxID=273116 RepID=Q978H0_THEVO|nr:hypothetical protein [Thermoplasma volcanium]BAB60587.1 TVG1493094 [Thermoplasma volcanium GSS1]
MVRGIDETNSQDEPKNTAIQDEKTEKTENQLTFRKIITDDKRHNPVPSKYKPGMYVAMTISEARQIKAYNFSSEVSEREFKAMADEPQKKIAIGKGWSP